MTSQFLVQVDLSPSETYRDLNKIGCDMNAKGCSGASRVWAAASEIERLRYFEKLWRSGIPASALGKFEIVEK